MQAVIPAAGAGTRLGSLTEQRPKVLLPVDGQPLMEYAFETLAELPVDEVLVVIGYRGEQIVEHFGDRYGELPITYIHQRDRQGLAHAVELAGEHLDGPFIVHNGDNIINTNLDAVVDPVVDGSVDGSILVEQVTEAHAKETGVLEVTDGRVRRVVEKPDDPSSTLVTTGFYVLPEPAIHACALAQPRDTGERELTTAVDLLARAQYDIEPVPIDGWRVNVNTELDINRATRLLNDDTSD